MIRVYTSFFIAIPLPEKYLDSFKILIKTIQLMYPDIPTVNPETPHLTLYYLIKEAEQDLNKINISVGKCIPLLKDAHLTVGGFNYFGQDQPKTLYLDAEYPDDLINFNQQLNIDLEKYSAHDNDLGFKPHLTVASVKDSVAQKKFQENKDEIAKLFNEVKWNFPITEIVLYGANSKSSPEIQEQLVHYSLVS